MKSMGRQINVEKIRSIVFKSQSEKTCIITCDGEMIEKVDNYVHLERLFASDRKIDVEIARRSSILLYP